MRSAGPLSGQVLGAAAIIIGTLIVVATMWVFGWGFFQQSTADFRGETDAIEKTRADGDYRIAGYDKFFDLCASVQSAEATINALEDELATDPSDERVEQINATLTAVRASRAESINEYNADASKEATVADFHASNLPARLTPATKETQCVAE